MRNLENVRPARAPQSRRRDRPTCSPHPYYVRSETRGMSASQRSARSDGGVDRDTSTSITLAGICRSRAHCEAAHPRRSFFRRPRRATSPDIGCWVPAEGASSTATHNQSRSGPYRARIITVADMPGGGPFAEPANLCWLIDRHLDGNTTIFLGRQLRNGPDSLILRESVQVSACVPTVHRVRVRDG